MSFFGLTPSMVLSCCYFTDKIWGKSAAVFIAQHDWQTPTLEKCRL